MLHLFRKRWTYCFALLVLVSAACILPGKIGYTAPTDSSAIVITHPEWSRNAAIYEVNIRQFTPEGTLKAFETHLPRLRELGVDILWLMPIHPIGEVNRKGSLGSYYSVRDYKTVNPEFGTLDDLKSVVKSAHELGMYVIIDWVANHSAWDNPLAAEHPDWYTQNEQGQFVSPVPDWHDVIDLNYDNPDLREYMIGTMEYWLREADLDGFRCDVAGMVPWDFWSEARQALDQIKPVFMLAEDEAPAAHEHGFDMTYSWELFKLMAAIAKGDSNANTLHRYFAEEVKRYPLDAYRMRFTDNHDENSWNGTVRERFGDGAAAFAVLCGTIPGMPLIYSGQEAGLEKRLDFFERDPIEWQDSPMQEIYQKLLELKHNNPVLGNGSFGGSMQRIKTDKDQQVFSFIRHKDEQAVLVMVNLSGSPQTVRMLDDHCYGDYLNWFTGEPFGLAHGTQINLEPWDYRVLVR